MERVVLEHAEGVGNMSITSDNLTVSSFLGRLLAVLPNRSRRLSVQEETKAYVAPADHEEVFLTSRPLNASEKREQDELSRVRAALYSHDQTVRKT